MRAHRGGDDLALGQRYVLHGAVVRDLMFAGYRTFNQFLQAGEGIATNILADRVEGAPGP